MVDSNQGSKADKTNISYTHTWQKYYVDWINSNSIEKNKSKYTKENNSCCDSWTTREQGKRENVEHGNQSKGCCRVKSEYTTATALVNITSSLSRVECYHQNIKSELDHVRRCLNDRYMNATKSLKTMNADATELSRMIDLVRYTNEKIIIKRVKDNLEDHFQSLDFDSEHD